MTAPPPVIAPPIQPIWMPCGDEISYNPLSQNFTDPMTLANAAHVLLERVKAVYAEAGVELPKRQIWIGGEAAFDCEELVVSLMSMRSGALPNRRGIISPVPICDPFLIAIFEVTVVRCVPVPNDRGTPPSPDALATAADLTAVDAFLLLKSACRFDLWNNDPQPSDFNYDPGGGMEVESSIAVGTAQGGMQAVTLTLHTVIG